MIKAEVLVDNSAWKKKLSNSSKFFNRILKHSCAILDEAQNATDTQIKMLLTRIGENYKIVVNGDTTHRDLPNKGMSVLER